MGAGSGEGPTGVAVPGSGGPPTDPPPPFGDRLHARVAARRSQLVLGLDPDPARLWPRAIELAGGAGAQTAAPAPPDAHAAVASPAERAAKAVAVHCTLAIEAAGEHCVATKLQVACFERLGAPGWAALQEVVTRAKEHGLLVIADAKRGDIDVSAAAYAQAFLSSTPTPFGPVRGLDADALTVNPLLGADSLAPFVAAARTGGAGLFVLARTSNPGAQDIQELELAGGGIVSERIARLVHELGASRTSDNESDNERGSGLSDVGAVVGATAPDRLERLRELMPRTVFLLPGVGAQGGHVADLAAAFAPGIAGGLVSASRGIVAAHEKRGGDPAAAAAAEAERLRELTWSLTG